MPKSELFTIGEFSAITGIGIHSLRYYDEIGALKPEYVDPVSNYRYYGFRQLSRIPAINLCKDAGINLSNFDSFLIDGSVDYERLLDESRKSLEHKINGFRMKQREIEQVGAILSVEHALRKEDVLKMHLDSIRVLKLPLEEQALESGSSGMLKKISAEAHKRGKTISALFCGIMRTHTDGYPARFVFTHVPENNGDQTHDCGQLISIPAGEYLIRRTDAFGMQAAEKAFAADEAASGSDTVVSLSFICDDPEPLFCAAALIA